MNQEKIDHRWQQRKSRIDKLVSLFLHNDFPAIEHKPPYLALLQLPPEYDMEERKSIS